MHRTNDSFKLRIMGEVHSEKTKFVHMVTKPFFLFLLLCAGTLSAQHSLEIQVEDVRKGQGHIRVALYNNAEGFLHFDQVYAARSAPAHKGRTRVVFDDLPAGTYAVALYHDSNGNSKLDKNFLGIPKEKVAFSHAKMRTFGPPDFEDCAFELKEDTRLKIAL
jgi:uncharacterized protein (DUF2141 family)